MSEIVRVKKNRENPYVMIDKGLLADPTLSWKAKGLLAYLLSKPDNWCVSIAHLVKQSTDGEKATRAALNELKKRCYLQKFPVYKGNRIVNWESTVYEVPFTEEERIAHKKTTKDGEILVLAEKGKVLQSQTESVLAGNVQVQNVQVQNVLVQKGDTNNTDSSNKGDIPSNHSTNQGDGRLAKIIEDSNVHLFKDQYYDPKVIEFIIGQVTTMWYSSELKVGNAKIPQPVVRKMLENLNIDRIFYVANEWIRITEEQEITNPNAYMAVMIYNSLTIEPRPLPNTPKRKPQPKPDKFENFSL